MGIIDETSVKLTCEKCAADDVVRAVQKGSSYNLGSWSNFRESSKFDVQSKQGLDGPELISAMCKKCKVPARIG